VYAQIKKELRGSKNNQAVAAAAAAAAAKCTGIFAHRIDPQRALCPFDLRGLCHDPKCPWLSRGDYTLCEADRATAAPPFMLCGGGNGKQQVTMSPQHPQCLSLRDVSAAYSSFWTRWGGGGAR
jgi:hypothetical protein